MTGMPTRCSTRRAVCDAPWAPNFCFSTLSDSGGEQAGCFVSQQTCSYQAAAVTARTSAAARPPGAGARTEARGSREQTTLRAAEPCTGPASAFPQSLSGGSGCRRRGTRHCGAEGPLPRSPARALWGGGGSGGAGASFCGRRAPSAGGERQRGREDGWAAVGGARRRRAPPWQLPAGCYQRSWLSQLQKASIEVCELLGVEMHQILQLKTFCC